MRGLARAALAVGAAGAGVLAWSLVEAEAYTLRRYTVPVLPPGARARTILHLSDLHLLPRQQRRVDWVASLAAERPDAVITTGDNLASPRALPTVLSALLPFLHLPGAFVTGSNDFVAPEWKNPLRYLSGPSQKHRAPSEPNLPGDELVGALTAAGWQHLDNARGRLDLDGVHLDLVGTGDAHIDADHYPAPADPPAGGAPSVRIGVTHAPYARVLRAMADDGARLVLAGHTHGGQVCVPGLGALVTNCDLDRRRASGLHPWPGRPGRPGAGAAGPDDLWLHVSAGLGTSPFTPVRLACRPEATLLTLVPETAAG
ncbi:metallophosphoesterase [Pseudactinotalea sp. HY158]|uniref:metallophosphoesterase n=1 Tax=Pseudactinotalea sp. HY158 TaxID=2654547 RepID=UPI00129CDE2B|nr:metallophosphoesterase [Pseudactinotalea sp. HY158]QGH68358.1 metallophosphoesterase [Pseudactinotalea sp. HY158]